MRSILRPFVLALALAALVVPWPATLSAQTVQSGQLDALAPREIGPANMSGRLVDIAVVESDTRVFYIAGATGGLWKTTDNGLRFEQVFRNEAVHSIGDVAVHQTAIMDMGQPQCRLTNDLAGVGDIQLPHPTGDATDVQPVQKLHH